MRILKAIAGLCVLAAAWVMIYNLAVLGCRFTVWMGTKAACWPFNF